jgi:hypothetical protein
MSLAPRRLLPFACALTCMLPISAFGQVLFDSVVAPLPPNVASIGYEATATYEYGTGIVFAPGTSRLASSVTVIMSSWACFSGNWERPGSCSTPAGSTFNHPLTVNVYAVGAGNTVGALLETRTQVFAIPYRPSPNPSQCTADPRMWFNAATGTCSNGLAFPATFDLPGLSLPNQVIITVAFNTTHYGNNPLGTGTACSAAGNCPYDSLNISADTAGPFTGAYLDSSSAYYRGTDPAAYCDGGAGGTGTLRLDFGCDGPYQPQIRVTALPAEVYQVRYFSNLTAGDSYINISNSGAAFAAGALATGDICANTYTYSPDEQLISCCSCLVTPNGLASLSVKNDLIVNTLTPILPTSVVVKLVATRAGASTNSCNAATVGSASSAGFTSGMLAWGATLHPLPVTAGSPATTYGISGTAFSQPTLTTAELTRMTQLCSFIQANGSGYGICKSCKVGGLGSSIK